jgi:hypothetical protein
VPSFSNFRSDSPLILMSDLLVFLDSGFEDSERCGRGAADAVGRRAFQDQIRLSPCSPYLFPSDQNPSGHIRTLKTTWEGTLRRAKVPYFRIYDLRSTYATWLSAGGVVDEWITQMLRQGDAQVFNKYSQMKLQMKREALEKLNRHANEMPAQKAGGQVGTVTVQ